jgi:hypothetical protein
MSDNTNKGELLMRIEALTAERDALVAQNYECKFFIESVMANIGAGATLSEVTDMLSDWWDSSFAANKTPTQCLREIQAEAIEGAASHLKSLITAPPALYGGAYIKLIKYAERIRKGEKP